MRYQESSQIQPLYDMSSNTLSSYVFDKHRVPQEFLINALRILGQVKTNVWLDSACLVWRVTRFIAGVFIAEVRMSDIRKGGDDFHHMCAVWNITEASQEIAAVLPNRLGLNGASYPRQGAGE